MTKKVITKKELLSQVEELRSRLEEAQQALRAIQSGEAVTAAQVLKVHDESGKPWRVVGATLDMTDRKKAEEALRESEERFRSAFDNGAVPMALTTPALVLLRVNPAYCRLLRLDESQVVGHSVLEFTHPDDASPTHSALDSVVKDKQPTLRLEKRYVAKDGRLLWVDVSSAPVYDAQGELLYLVTHVQDITERKQAEVALRKSNERQELLAETASQLLTSDEPQEIIDALCARVLTFLDCQAFFNYLVDDEKKRLRLNACAGIPDDVAAGIEWLNLGQAVCGCVARDGVRVVAENIQETPDPRTDLVRSLGIQAYASHPLLAQGRVIGTLSFGTRTRAHFTEDELAVMKVVADQVAIAMQRRRAAEALKASEERARDQAAQLQAVLDAAPAIIWTAHDRECRNITGNRASQELLRVPEGTNVSKSGPASELLAHYRVCKDGVELAPQDMPIQLTAASGQGFNNYAMDIVFDNGSVRSLLGNVTPLLDFAGRPNGAIAAFMDITERKQAEQERERLLAENSQQRRLLETLFEADPDGLAVVVGKELDIQLANPAYQAFTPRPTENPVGQRWDRVWASAVIPEAASAIRCTLVTGEPVDDDSQKRIYPDGRTRYFSFHVRRLLWNTEYAALIVLQETTAIEQARQEAQRQAAELDAVVTSIADGVMIHDMASAIIRMNPAAERIMGYSPEERKLPLAQRTTKAIQLISSDGQPLTDAEDLPVPRALRGESVSSRVMRVHHGHTGKPVWVTVSAAPIRTPEGVMLGAVSTLTDITDLRQIQQRLEQSNAQLQAQTEELEVQAEKLQVTAQELSKSRDELELRVQERTAELAQANAELRLASAYNRSLIEASLDPLVTIGPDGKITDVNTATEHVTGCPRVELIGTDFSNYFTEPEKARAGYQQVFREGIVRDYELELVHRDGLVTSVLYNASVYRDEAGRVIGLFAAARDITKRKWVEAQLERNNEELRALSLAERSQRLLAEILSAASLALTQSLNLETVMETLLDYLERLVPYDSANAMLLESESRMAVRVTRGYERWGNVEQVRAITFDVQANPILNELLTTGKSILVSDSRAYPGWEIRPGAEGVRSWIGVPLAAGGNVIGLYSLDKTEPGFFTQEHVRLAELLAGQAAVAIQNARLFEQVRAGREQLRLLTRQVVSVQEQERRRVSRELHDEAGQALTALKISLELMLADLPDQVASLRERIHESAMLTDDAMERIRLLARDLRPPALDAVGLGPTLEDVCRDFGERIQLSIDYASGELPALPDTVSICLYRVLQEALTNVAKHAHARHVRVALRRDVDLISLSVEDDGQGFDPQSILSPTGRPVGIGLSGMQDRLELLGGRLEIDSRPGRGTRLVAYAPWEGNP